MQTSFFNGAFYNGDFFFGGKPPVFVKDTHDGARKRKKFAKQREEAVALKQQIREAFYGPDPVEKSSISATPLQTREKVYIADYEIARKLSEYEQLMADDDEAITILLLK
jgi:hypothetical protein